MTETLQREHEDIANETVEECYDRLFPQHEEPEPWGYRAAYVGIWAWIITSGVIWTFGRAWVTFHRR